MAHVAGWYCLLNELFWGDKAYYFMEIGPNKEIFYVLDLTILFLSVQKFTVTSKCLDWHHSSLPALSNCFAIPSTFISLSPSLGGQGEWDESSSSWF